MNKFSLKQELFRKIINIILEQWHDVNDELYVCSQKSRKVRKVSLTGLLL